MRPRWQHRHLYIYEGTHAWSGLSEGNDMWSDLCGSTKKWSYLNKDINKWSDLSQYKRCFSQTQLSFQDWKWWPLSYSCRSKAVCHSLPSNRPKCTIRAKCIRKAFEWILGFWWMLPIHALAQFPVSVSLLHWLNEMSGSLIVSQGMWGCNSQWGGPFKSQLVDKESGCQRNGNVTGRDASPGSQRSITAGRGRECDTHTLNSISECMCCYLH